MFPLSDPVPICREPRRRSNGPLSLRGHSLGQHPSGGAAIEGGADVGNRRDDPWSHHLRSSTDSNPQADGSRNRATLEAGGHRCRGHTVLQRLAFVREDDSEVPGFVRARDLGFRAWLSEWVAGAGIRSKGIAMPTHSTDCLVGGPRMPSFSGAVGAPRLRERPIVADRPKAFPCRREAFLAFPDAPGARSL